MTDIKLSTGAITKIMEGETVDAPIFQVLGHKKIQGGGGADRFRLNISDGVHSHSFAMLATQLNDMIPEGKLENLTVIRTDKIISNAVNQKVLIILEITILSTAAKDGQTKIGSPVQWTPENASLSKHGSGAGSSNGSSHSVSSSSDVKPNVAKTNGDAMKRPMPPSEPAKRPPGLMPPPASQGGPPTNFVPIADLTPYNTACTVRARVTLKTPIRTYSNSKGDGKLFSFNLLDDSGEMKACCFNQQVDRFYDMLELNQVFFISKFSLRTANRQFNNLNHDYEMSLSDQSTIYPCLTDTEDIPTQTFDFIKIEDIEQKPESSIVDIIGICKRVADISKVTQRSTNRELTKRDITLVDRSNKEINVTLWGKQAEDFNDTSQPVIAIKGAKVSDFNGKSASLLMSSVFEINPDIKEAHVLRGWYDNDGHKEQTTSLTTTGGRGGGGITPWKLLKEANSSDISSLEKGEYYMAKVTVTAMKKENLAYKACTKDGCNKKVVDGSDGKFRCEKCCVENETFNYRMMLQVCFGDISDTVWGTCFQEAAELLMDEKASNIGLWQDEDPQKLEKAIHKSLFKSYIVKFRSKMESYNDENRRKTSVVQVNPINFQELSTHLLSELKEYI